MAAILPLLTFLCNRKVYWNACQTAAILGRQTSISGTKESKQIPHTHTHKHTDVPLCMLVGSSMQSRMSGVLISLKTNCHSSRFLLLLFLVICFFFCFWYTRAFNKIFVGTRAKNACFVVVLVVECARVGRKSFLMCVNSVQGGSEACCLKAC